jgi:hypothetical protein
MRGRVLGSLVMCALVVFVAAITAAPAHAQTPYCVNGATTTLPVTLTGGGGATFVLTESGAEFFLAAPGNGTFYIGLSIAAGTPLALRHRPPPFDPATILQPGYSTNTVSRGACTAAFVNLDRNFWLCYSRFQTDPAVFSRSEAIANYTAGMTVPFAVREPLSSTRLASGLYLVCNLPAGYTAQSGVAVSTGGGETVQGDAGRVSFLLGSMPLDYTRLAARA